MEQQQQQFYLSIPISLSYQYRIDNKKTNIGFKITVKNFYKSWCINKIKHKHINW